MKKNITRRLTTALLAAAMCVSMAACGSKTDDTKTDGTGDADGAKKYTIGVCQLVTHDALDAATQGFIDAVKDKLGEENVTIDVQNAANDQNVCTTIVNTFVSKKVDLIMANATPALQAAYNATAEIPILGTSVTEYGVALGIDNFSGTVDERVALDHLSLTLRDGDFVTVIGGNGAGKSTMQNAICGTWQPDEGSIELDGVNVSSLPEYKRARYLGRVYQDPMMGTSAGMEIEENLALAERRGRHHTLRPGIRHSEREDYRRRLRELGLGLEDRLTTKVGTLSGGQRQALTLLMATLKKPKLLLLDEHTAALDPQTAQRVMDITDRLVRENHLTTLMITHNMRDAIHYGNRLLMLHNGRIVLDISGEEKARLTVPDLLALFSKVSGQEYDNDRALLA